MDVPSGFKLNRRSFFILSSLGVIAGGSACGIKLYGQLLEVNEQLVSSRKLSQYEKENLPALYSAMTGETDPQQIKEAVEFFAIFLSKLPLSRRKELNLGLKVLDILPLFFMVSFLPFRKIDLKQQVVFLQKLSQGPAVLYPLFGGLKELMYLAYYRVPQNYQKIEYYGPVAKPNEPIEEHQRFYKALMAELS
ncbi:MAG: hypothetical protein HYV97_08285 [Bdellovibrio sp.]|nr:hypothetical protein [Bdellovibrio sp.]